MIFKPIIAVYIVIISANALLYYFIVCNMNTICFVQIAREMVISPRNAKLGLTALTKKIGLMDQPDSPDGEMIKYKVFLALMIFLHHFTMHHYLHFY